MYEPTNWEEWFSETFPEFTPDEIDTLADEAGKREYEMLVTERDVEMSDFLGTPIADWNVFFAFEPIEETP